MTHAITGYSTRIMKNCINCGKPALKHRRRCGSCQHYYYKNHVEKPAHAKGRTYRKSTSCTVCGDMDYAGRGLCKKCYAYHRRTGKRRPYYLWSSELVCKVCSKPLNSLDKSQRVKNKCRPCDTYQQKMKRPRPSHLWGIGSHGWCECGWPAIEVIEGIPVCKSCLDLELS